MNNQSAETFEEQNPVLPDSLQGFDLEIAGFNPLQVYMFTYEQKKWEQAKQAISPLIATGEISKSSFIELDLKGDLSGVYARDLHRVLHGGIVELIREAAYQKANPPE